MCVKLRVFLLTDVCALNYQYLACDRGSFLVAQSRQQAGAQRDLRSVVKFSPVGARRHYDPSDQHRARRSEKVSLARVIICRVGVWATVVLKEQGTGAQ